MTRFLDHTQRRTTVGRTLLDELSDRRRDLYLTIHNNHNRQTSITLVGFEPTVSTSEWPQTHALDRAVTDIGKYYTFTLRKFTKHRITTLFSSQDSAITTKQQKLPTAPWRSTIEDLSAEMTVRTRHSFCTSRWSRADPCKYADVSSSMPVPV